jgi:hypothetical protein
MPPPVDCSAFLPGFTFADCYATGIPPGMDAIAVARAGFSSSPKWAAALLDLRNWLVSWIGLKGAKGSSFPIISQTPDLVCLGFDDWHLDFRIVVTASPTDSINEATLTTIVRTNNFTGRAYLFLIMPFHKLIARQALSH